MNCTAAYDGQTCEIWAPTQNLTAAHTEAVRLTGLPPHRVKAHVTFMGGGFGRRSNVDYAAFAVEIAMAVRRPVKVIWSREEDIRHDHYRPAGAVRIDAGIDSGGDLIAWNYHVATPSVNALYSPKSKDIDWAAEENANDRPYDVPNMRLQWSRIEFPIPIWTWRSVGSSINTFASEAMLDEVAATAGSDPFEYRRKLLAQSPRELAVLEAAAQKASWGKGAGGVHQGIAFSALRGSALTHVIDIRMKGYAVKIERITCAVDCGVAVNPKIVESQIAGGTIFGLTAALWGKVSIKNGAVVEGNFDTYPMLRINQTPPIDVVIVESSLSPQGIGETGVAGIGPALANAIASATGKRIRRLPLSESGITLA
jgi:CO/xanthine dehydrogenase Mo-binding subunit